MERRRISRYRAFGGDRSESRQINIALNFHEKLKRLVSTSSRMIEREGPLKLRIGESLAVGESTWKTCQSGKARQEQ